MITTCKICGGSAKLFCDVDFNRTCEDQHAGQQLGPRKLEGPVFEPAGWSIAYCRCERCGLIFTSDLDDWSMEEFRVRIYNEDYIRADPDFVEARPRITAAEVIRWWGPAKQGIEVLDYGGGNGRFAELLRASGFRAETYDPVMPGFRALPERQFDLVTCFETLEHMPDPVWGAADIAALLKPDGCLLFSTVTQPPNIEELGASWWYIGPRNGHITLYSKAALAELWRPHGLHVVSFDSVVHAAFRTPPPYLTEALALATA